MALIEMDFAMGNSGGWNFPDISSGCTNLTPYSTRFSTGADGYARYKDIDNKRYIEIKGSISFSAGGGGIYKLFDDNMSSVANKPRYCCYKESNTNNNYGGITWNVDGTYIGVGVNVSGSVSGTVDYKCIIDL